MSKNDLDKLKKAIQLSVSSYGLQLYKTLIIENQDIKNKLRPVSWNQNQITDASYLFVFCNYTEATHEAIDNFIKQTAEIRNLDLERLSGYGDFIKSKLAEKSQTYLALGNLLNACAELKIDACPIEGFEPKAYNQILGLDKQGLNASVIAPIGYRKYDDNTIKQLKVRKPIEILFDII